MGIGQSASKVVGNESRAKICMATARARARARAVINRVTCT